MKTTLLIILFLGTYCMAQQPDNTDPLHTETEELLVDPDHNQETEESELTEDESEHTDHAGEALVEIDHEIQEEIDIRIAEAQAGTITKSSTFPAEIKLNRDQAASVSARYASVIRQVFAEIGDSVKKGDVLASLENRETLAVYTLSAPLDGVVIAKDLAVGETADAGKMLYEVADLERVWADINIFPQYQHLIKKDMAVDFIAYDDHTAHGTVKYISPIVSHETRTFTARCVLKGARADFTPGAFVRARIAVQTTPVNVQVNREAVQTIEGETVVFVPEEHGFGPLTVKTGLSDEQFVEITEGLEAGAEYVADGAFALKAELITSGMDPHAGHNH
jgi:cobalt-zinc-cadmium efflux system membrane fusion protein